MLMCGPNLNSIYGLRCYLFWSNFDDVP